VGEGGGGDREKLNEQGSKVGGKVTREGQLRDGKGGGGRGKGIARRREKQATQRERKSKGSRGCHGWGVVDNTHANIKAAPLSSPFTIYNYKYVIKSSFLLL
jgi:hypothetical protein